MFSLEIQMHSVKVRIKTIDSDLLKTCSFIQIYDVTAVFSFGKGNKTHVTTVLPN